MYQSEPEILQSALNFLYNYIQSDSIRESVKKTGFYDRRPMFFYLQTLMAYSPAYQKYYKDLTRFSPDNLKTRMNQILKRAPDTIDLFLNKCWTNKTEFNKLRELSHSPYFSPQEVQNINRYAEQADNRSKVDLFKQLFKQKQLLGVGGGGGIPQTPAQPPIVSETDKQQAAYYLSEKIKKHGGEFVDSQKRAELVKQGIFTQEEAESVLKSGLVKFAAGGQDRDFKNDEEWDKVVFETAAGILEKKAQTTTISQPPTATQLPSLPKISVPSPVKTLSSNTLITTSKLLNRLPSFFAPLLNGTLNTILHLGGGLSNSLMGKAAAGGGRKVGSALSSGLAKKVGTRLLLSNPWVWAGIAVVVIFLVLLPGGLGLLETTALLPPFEADVAESAPLSPGGTEDITSCKFIRGAENPKAASFKSNLLLSYLQEAAKTAGMPTVILAAFARVESPSLVIQTDADLLNYKCATSDTGALGLMQLQPKGTVGHAPEAIAQGATFIGKKYEDLTRADYCDPRKSILMSTGFILKKMSYFGYGDGTKWQPEWNNDRKAINTLVSGYYGCPADNLRYGGPDPRKCEGPYDYGEDVWTSIQNCQPKTSPPTQNIASCPVQDGKIITFSFQKDNLKGHCAPQSYEFNCQKECPTTGRRAKAIDIYTGGPTGKDVVLPKLNNQDVNWEFLQSECAGTKQDGVCVESNGGTGFLYVFKTTTPGSSDSWHLQMVHMGKTGLAIKGTYPSGTVVGKTVEQHVHTTIGKNIKDPLSSGSPSTDCDQGWIPSDFLCNN